MDSTVERILKAAKEKKITQKELAAQIGVHAQVITDWKNGSTSYQRYMQKISDLLGVSADYLLTGQKSTAQNAADPELAAALSQFEKLTPEQRAKVIGYMEGLISSR